MEAALEKRLKRQVIGKPHLFLAVVPLGFEQTLADEIEFCHPRVVGDGKVEFTAKIVDAWKAVAYTRIANRILMHIADFKAENFRELEKKASEIPWELYLPCHPERSNASCEVEGSISIHVTCKHSRLYHSDAVAERLYNVIGNSFPAAATSSWRPQSRHLLNCHSGAEGDRAKAEDFPQNLFVTLIDDRCTLWLDLAGEELYKRGHERFVNDAPLKETIAAAMLHEILRLRATPSAQDDTRLVAAPITLIDPMAGSGTFSLEAAYMASGLIPGVCRDFALKHQPAFKPATWDYIVKQERVIPNETPNGMESKSLIANIITSDISERAVGIIRHNVESSPLAQTSAGPLAHAHAPTIAPTIAPHLKDFFSYTAEEIIRACSTPKAPGTPEANSSQPAIVLNPRYGKRLDCNAPELYTQIGRKLTELARGLNALGKTLSVAILAPKDDTRNGAKYTCTSNLLRECPALDPAQNPQARQIVTSHGGLSLNAFFASL